jgi:3-methyladenine DNA glycosylase AlkD
LAAGADLDPIAASEAISADLKVLGTPARAESERAYLKSELEFFGTSVPHMRTVVKRFLRMHPGLDHDRLLETCRALWAPVGTTAIHERRAAAVLLLDELPTMLSIDDVPTIEQLIRESKTWAYVDTLAGHVVARLAASDPAMLGVLDRWLVDDDFWIRRAAVLALGDLLRDGREMDRFFRYADTLLPEKEFFIRKVLGWVARETGRRYPDDVSAWLRRNQSRMNGVTIREAVKYLPDGAEVLALWKNR